MDTLNDWLVVNDMFITTSEYTDKIYIGEENNGAFKTFKRDDFYKVLKKFYEETPNDKT